MAARLTAVRCEDALVHAPRRQKRVRTLEGPSDHICLRPLIDLPQSGFIADHFEIMDRKVLRQDISKKSH